MLVLHYEVHGEDRLYDFVTKFEKVCLGLIAPKFEVPQGWPLAGTC